MKAVIESIELTTNKLKTAMRETSYRGEREELRLKISTLSDLIGVLRALESGKKDDAQYAAWTLEECAERIEFAYDLDVETIDD